MTSFKIGSSDPINDEDNRRTVYNRTIQENMALDGMSNRQGFDTFMDSRDDLGSENSLYENDPQSAANADWRDYMEKG